MQEYVRLTKEVAIKATVLVLLLVSIFLLGYYSTKSRLVTDPNTKNPALLTLVNLPDNFCPKTAQVLLIKEKLIVSEGVKAVDNCRTITLGPGLSNNKILIKLPQSLAFELDPSTQATWEYSPVIGDVTNDNLVNSQDESAVKDALFTNAKNTATDVDNDGEVTMTDLVLVRLHEGVGIDRPDGRSWTL